jgi:[acyl-carrier-protein] S-malonyltransferase
VTGPAFLFPNHTPETAGTAAALLTGGRFDAWLERAEAVCGLAIRRAVAVRPAAALGATAVAQPALVALSLAVAEGAAAQGLRPAFVAGHGLGAYAAAVVAGVLAPEDALRLAAERGRLLAAAEQQQTGGMGYVTGAALDTVFHVCAVVRERHGYVTVAHANSPRQAVVSGNASAVAEAVERLRRRGATAGLLPVRVAHNSLLMATVQARLARVAATMPWRDAHTPLVGGAGARPLRAGADVRAALIGGETQPVHWTGAMSALLDHGCRDFLELGAGWTLTALARQSAGDVVAMGADSPARIAAFRRRLTTARHAEVRLAS